MPFPDTDFVVNVELGTLLFVRGERCETSQKTAAKEIVSADQDRQKPFYYKIRKQREEQCNAAGLQNMDISTRDQLS